MKEKCFKTLLLFLGCCITMQVVAQSNKDTSFVFYFGVNQFKTDAQQQKAFETFLKNVQGIKTIRGFADTTGAAHYNKQLAQKRAGHIHNLLPDAIKARFNENNIRVTGETSDNAELWQNRRVEVIAVTSLPTEIMETNFVTANDTLQKLNADNILFIPDQPELTEASFQYVKMLAQQLQQFKTGTFLIIGHVNYQSKLPPERLKDLYQLSHERAKNVYDLLVTYGIDASRMKYKGVGNSDSVYPEPQNDDQKRANMRVQVLILRD